MLDSFRRQELKIVLWLQCSRFLDEACPSMGCITSNNAVGNAERVPTGFGSALMNTEQCVSVLTHVYDFTSIDLFL